MNGSYNGRTMTDAPLFELTVQERAAHLLITPDALVQLSLADARKVVRYMLPKRVAAGTAIFQAGEATDIDHMLLVIDGDVTVESQASPASEGMVVTVLGAGSLIGEMGLIDGEPRSATCIAATDLSVGMLSRAALTRLIQEQPAVAARLLLAISKRLSDHLREANRKLMTFTQVSRALQQELDAAHAVNRRLLPPRASTGAEPAA
jgi:CRP/FNR family transcriptional regulator, cyclic AMP receptor protein